MAYPWLDITRCTSIYHSIHCDPEEMCNSDANALKSIVICFLHNARIDGIFSMLILLISITNHFPIIQMALQNEGNDNTTKHTSLVTS